MILFKQRSIRYLDGNGGHYSRNLKAIKRENLTRPRDIALQLAHKDEVIHFAAHKIKAAIAVKQTSHDPEKVTVLLEEVLRKIAEEV